jgi:D-aspartate ligase
MMAPPTDISVPAVVLKLYHGGLAAVRSLGRLGVEVHGVVEDRGLPGAASRYLAGVHVWNLDTAPADESVAWLVALARRIGGRPLLIPTEDVGAMLVADHADVLGEVFRFPQQPPGLARELSNKEGMRRLCSQHGVPTPAASRPSTRDEAIAFAAEHGYPVVLKGVGGGGFERSAGTRVVVVGDTETLKRVWSQLDSEDPDLLMQEYIPGGADSVWMFNAYFDAESRCRFGVTGQKLRQYPPHTGFTSLGICRDSREVRETTCAFMQALGYRGILDIGYRYDARDGRYQLLDVNPRLGSTFRLFVGRYGLDVIRALYLDLTGQTIEHDVPKPGRKWVIENLDLAASVRYFRNDELGLLAWLGSFRGVEEAAWFSRDDLRPFAAMIRDSVRHAVPEKRP